MKVMNAVIDRTSILEEDGRGYTVMIFVDHETGHQGFGGFVFPEFNMGLFITKAMEAVGCDCWEKMKGRHCRVVYDETTQLLVGIGAWRGDNWFYKSDLPWNPPSQDKIEA